MHSNTSIMPYASKLTFMFFVQVSSNCETDLIYPIIEKISILANVSYSLADDHIKMNLTVCHFFSNCKIFSSCFNIKLISLL